MPIFHCTKKLLTHLGVAAAGADVLALATQGSPPRLGYWYANLIQLEQRKAVLYTNERTLFSFFMLKIRAKSVGLFPSAFVQGLSAALALEGHSPEQISAVVDEYLGFAAFAPAANKTVLGSMNAITQDLKHMIWYDGGFREADVGKLIHLLNNTPWSATGFKYSSELVREILSGARPQ